MYQRLLHGIAGYQELGNQIIKEIKAAHAFRQVETVCELSKILINIPVREYQLIAQYYLVWCDFQQLKYPVETLETIIEQTKTYKARALFSRGGVEGYRGNTETAIYFYKEALKTSPTVSEFIELVRSVAVLKSQEGFHKSALKDLENLIPLMRYAEPRLYYDLLNSYAVELCEANRLEEARNVSALAVSSPFGPYYAAWQETFAEVNQKLSKSRSRVSVSVPEPTAVAEPERAVEPEPARLPEQGVARIIKFPKLKRPEASREVPVALTPIQWLAVVLKAMLKERITDEEIERICSSYYELVVDFYS